MVGTQSDAKAWSGEASNRIGIDSRTVCAPQSDGTAQKCDGTAQK